MLEQVLAVAAAMALPAVVNSQFANAVSGGMPLTAFAENLLERSAAPYLRRRNNPASPTSASETGSGTGNAPGVQLT
jgi:hypothetical protein